MYVNHIIPYCWYSLREVPTGTKSDRTRLTLNRHNMAHYPVATMATHFVKEGAKSRVSALQGGGFLSM